MNWLCRLLLTMLGLCLQIGYGLDAVAATATASPSSCASVAFGGDVSWANPGNAVSSNNQYATASVGGGGTTNQLRCSGYGFAIPATAVITSITVNIERDVSGGNFVDLSVQLLKGGVLQNTNNADTSTTYPNSDGVATYGGDLWGGAWSAVDINAANFGVAFAAERVGGNNSRTVSVDHIQVVVTYLVPRSCISIRNGLWSAATTWNCGSGNDGPPTSVDSATINGHTVSVDASATVTSLTNNSGILQQTGTATRVLTVNGDFSNNGTVIDNGASGSFDVVVSGALNNSANSFTVDNLTVLGSVTNNVPMTVRSAMALSGDL